MRVLRQENDNTLTYFKRHMSFALVRYIFPFIALFLGTKLFMDHPGHGIIFSFHNSQIFFPASFILVIFGTTQLLKSFKF